FGMCCRERFGGQRRRRSVACWYFHNLEAKRRQYITVGGIAGSGDGNPVTRVEKNDKGESEGSRRANRNNKALRRNRNIAVIGVMADYRLSNFNKTQSTRVPYAPTFQGAFRRLADRNRHRIGRLHYRHWSNRVPGCATAVRLRKDVPGVKGLNFA